VPVFPLFPSADNMFDFTNRDGVFTRYKFNATSNNWDIVFISLPALVIKNIPEAYARISEIEYPRFGEKVLEWDGFLYTFEGTNSWTGVPATDAIIAQAIEDKIDDTNLDPCTKGIMTQLKNATNTDITKVLAKFVPSNIYNVTMKMGITKPNNFAETTKISKNNYLITVTDNSFTTATKLYKATGMLHEMIHAYMLSVVDDYNTYSYPTNDPFNGFPKLFNLYALNAGVGNSVIAQHEDMANKYVDAIASALEAYQANIGIPFSLADKQVFEDMAWSGLQGTDVYNAKFPKGSINDNRITARIGAEINGVYSQGQYAIGKPCN
jgi:hypothetical protein